MKVGDIIYYSGVIYTARDKAHQKIINILKNGGELPFNLKNSIIYHAGPIMKKTKEGWRCVSIGPTTSARMDDLEEEFIKLTRISAIVGKGGMKEELLKTFNEYNVSYLAAPGGCAALLAKCIKKVRNVYFLELGMPEAVWELEVKDFGPLVVTMDSNFNSIYKEVNEHAKKRLKEMIG
ncbi:FumA C-terminus/TtdB family hydratase beta subunit [Methanocaldococcus sp.]